MGKRTPHHLLKTMGAATLAFAWSGAVQADHFWIDPRLELKLGFSDNTNLTEANRQSDFVGNISPGINTRYESARVQAALDYSYDYLYFISDGGTEGRHNLFGSLEAEVIEDHFFVSSRASMRQLFLDRGGSFSNSVANRTTNRRLVQNYTTTGRLQGGWRDFADWRFSYRLGLTFSPADNLADDTIANRFSDTTSHEFTASIGSGQRFNNLEWRIYGSSSRSDRSLTGVLDNVQDFSNEQVAADLTFKFNRHFQVLGTYGVTRNNFQSDALAADGPFWNAGFRLIPGPKLDMTVKIGEEGVRSTWYGRIQYFFNPRLDLAGTYTDTLTSNALVLNDNLQSFNFDENLGISDGRGIPIDESDPNFTLTDVDFRQRNAALTLTWRHKRTRAYLSANRELRTFDDNSGTATTMGASFGFDHRINDRTNVTGTVSYRQNQFEDNIRVDDFYVANLEWSRTLSRYFTFAVQYAHTQRQSNEQGADLMENALTIYLRGTF